MKNSEISISREKPVSGGPNSFPGKVTEINRSEYGMEITLNAGELFYTELVEKDFRTSGIKEGDEAWVSFQPEALIILNSTQQEH
jgi:hypothetical protein